METRCACAADEAWSLTKERIGQGLCDLYSMPQDLPARLLILVEKLAGESPKLIFYRWIRKLDAVEGNLLLRGFRKPLA
jgi:hypothetical protein